MVDVKKWVIKHKVITGVITAIVVLSLLIPGTPSKKSSGAIAQPTSAPETITQASPTPTPVLSIEERLNAICKSFKPQECIVDQEKGLWYVTAIIQDGPYMFRAGAEQQARDFIFAFYSSGIPIQHVGVSINNYETKKYYRAGLAKEDADRQAAGTFTNPAIDGTTFDTYLSGLHGNSSDINSSYLETNLR